MNFDPTSLSAFMNMAGKYPLLSRKEETALLGKVVGRKRGWKAAAETLLLSNLRLVVKIARDFSYSSIPIEDLVSEGVIGLQGSIDRFQMGRNAKLSTYASWWIKQRMRRYIADHGREVRLPVHANEKLFKFNRVRAQIAEELGREPTVEEISEATGMEVKAIEKLYKYDSVFLPIDAPIGFDGSDATFGDILADENASMADRKAELNTDYQIATDILGKYPKREQSIIVRRLGLDGGKPETLEALGRRFSVSRERIRQIQQNVISEIRDAIERKDRIAGMGIA